MDILHAMKKLCNVLYEKHFQHSIKEKEWKFGSTFTTYGEEETEIFYMGSRYEGKIMQGKNLETDHFLLEIRKDIKHEGVYHAHMSNRRIEYNRNELIETIIDVLSSEETCDIILNFKKENTFDRWEPYATGEKAKKVAAMFSVLKSQTFMAFRIKNEFEMDNTMNPFLYKLNVEKETLTLSVKSHTILETDDIAEVEKWCHQEKELYTTIKKMQLTYLDVLSELIKPSTKLTLYDRGVFFLAGKSYQVELSRKILRNSSKYHLQLTDKRHVFKDLEKANEFMMENAEKLGKSLRLKHLFK